MRPSRSLRAWRRPEWALVGAVVRELPFDALLRRIQSSSTTNPARALEAHFFPATASGRAAPAPRQEECWRAHALRSMLYFRLHDDLQRCDELRLDLDDASLLLANVLRHRLAPVYECLPAPQAAAAAPATHCYVSGRSRPYASEACAFFVRRLEAHGDPHRVVDALARVIEAFCEAFSGPGESLAVAPPLPLRWSAAADVGRAGEAPPRGGLDDHQLIALPQRAAEGETAAPAAPPPALGVAHVADLLHFATQHWESFVGRSRGNALLLLQFTVLVAAQADDLGEEVWSSANANAGITVEALRAACSTAAVAAASLLPVCADHLRHPAVPGQSDVARTAAGGARPQPIGVVGEASRWKGTLWAGRAPSGLYVDRALLLSRCVEVAEATAAVLATHVGTPDALSRWTPAEVVKLCRVTVAARELQVVSADPSHGRGPSSGAASGGGRAAGRRWRREPTSSASMAAATGPAMDAAPPKLLSQLALLVPPRLFSVAKPLLHLPTSLVPPGGTSSHHGEEASRHLPGPRHGSLFKMLGNRLLSPVIRHDRFSAVNAMALAQARFVFCSLCRCLPPQSPLLADLGVTLEHRLLSSTAAWSLESLEDLLAMGEACLLVDGVSSLVAALLRVARGHAFYFAPPAALRRCDWAAGGGDRDAGGQSDVLARLMCLVDEAPLTMQRSGTVRQLLQALDVALERQMALPAPDAAVRAAAEVTDLGVWEGMILFLYHMQKHHLTPRPGVFVAFTDTLEAGLRNRPGAPTCVRERVLAIRALHTLLFAPPEWFDGGPAPPAAAWSSSASQHRCLRAVAPVLLRHVEAGVAQDAALALAAPDRALLRQCLREFPRGATTPVPPSG